MKKIAMVLSLCFIMVTFAACTGTSTSDNQSHVQTQENSTDETVKQSTEADNSEENILIAYFTWAENTQVNDSDAIDVDATTSASVLVGNSARLAGWIQQEIGGDLFSIRVTEPYSSDYDECLDRAADEKAQNARPALLEQVENIEQYDTVFIGYPNWWYSCPMAILSFIEENDLSDKKVVLFCTHGTGGLASSVQDITAVLPDSCDVEENVIGVYRNDVDSAQSDIQSRLEKIGYSKVENEIMEQTTDDSEQRIIMTIDEQDFEIVLYDNEAANSLYEMLPITVTFEDYNATEKIAYLEDSLNTEGVTDTFDPDIGDFCLYKPWGNLSLFYNDFQSSSGLVSLGYVVSGMEDIKSMTDGFTATLSISN